MKKQKRKKGIVYCGDFDPFRLMDGGYLAHMDRIIPREAFPDSEEAHKNPASWVTAFDRKKRRQGL